MRLKSEIFLLLFVFLHLGVLSQEPIPCRKDTIWGFCNNKKEILIPYAYTKVSRFYNDLTTCVCINDSCGIINNEGKTISEFKYSSIKRHADFYFVQENNLWGILNLDGKPILNTVYSRIIYRNKMFFTQRKELVNNIKNDNNYIIKPDGAYYKVNEDTLLIYTEIPYDSDEKDEWGDPLHYSYLDTLGNTYVNGKYLYKPEIINTYFEIFSRKGFFLKEDKKPSYGFIGNNTLAFKLDKKWGFMDTLANNIIPPKYESTLGFSHHLAAVKQNGKWGYIDKKDSVVIPFKFKEVMHYGKFYFWGKNDSAWALFDYKGSPLTQYIFKDVSYFKEGLAYVKKDNYWGFIDSLGNMVIDFDYPRAFEFSEGLALVCKNDSSCGYIDKRGKTKIPFIFQYNYGGEFVNGIAEVRKKLGEDYLYGFINTKGKVIVPIKYHTCYDYNKFYEGLGMLQIPNDDFNIDYNKLFYVDQKGNQYYREK